MMTSFINRSAFVIISLVTTLLGREPASAAVMLVQRADYRQTSDSPWYPGIENGSLYLENFLAGELSSRTFVSPYISSPAGRKGHESGYYSVDGDDGIIDEFGRFGGSYVAGATSAPDQTVADFRFDFSATPAGQFPRSVGLVVTSAGFNTSGSFKNTTHVKAFDQFGQLIGQATVTDLPESIIVFTPSFRPYYTNGSRFMGLISDVGIASFTIDGVVAVDHVQYSFERIPEPASALLLVASSALVLRRRRG